MWYNILAGVPPCDLTYERGCAIMDILTFMLSVIAGVVSHYICKWLDGEE